MTFICCLVAFLCYAAASAVSIFFTRSISNEWGKLLLRIGLYATIVEIVIMVLYAWTYNDWSQKGIVPAEIFFQWFLFPQAAVFFAQLMSKKMAVRWFVILAVLAGANFMYFSYKHLVCPYYVFCGILDIYAIIPIVLNILNTKRLIIAVIMMFASFPISGLGVDFCNYLVEPVSWTIMASSAYTVFLRRCITA